MGLLDIPSPYLADLDGILASFATPTLRLMAWGVIAAVISMGLYWLISPQSRIARCKSDLEVWRRRLDEYEGDLPGAWPLIGRMLTTSLRQIGIVIGPALVASVPLVSLLAWLAVAYGYSYPEVAQAPHLRTTPATLHARWQADQASTPHLTVTDTSGRIVADVTMAAPVPVVHPRRWWNSLLGNPAGYLPERSGVDLVEIDLPRREYLSFGPPWLRWWPAPFLLTLIVISLLLKRLGGIQ
jgi:hypothetical protein